MRPVLFVILLFVIAVSCAPEQPVVLRDVIINDATLSDGGIVLKANAVLFNPNKIRLRLKKIRVDIFVDEKKTATVDQKLNELIKANSEFSVPLEVRLDLGETGILGTIFNLFGGKKHDLHFQGKIRVAVRGLPVSIPIDHKGTISF